MSLETDRIKSMLFEYPDKIPVSVGILPAAWMLYREALDELVCSHPDIFGECKAGACGATCRQDWHRLLPTIQCLRGSMYRS